jgi:Uma2 family endonuclease
MYATTPPRRWTVQEVYDLPADGNRYEVVHGELLVTPSPAWNHQTVVLRLTYRLLDYLKPLGLEDTLVLGPGDYFYGEEVYVQPDLFVVPADTPRGDWRNIRRLLLVVEVVSPSSARGDREVKRRAYQEAGAETYWVVDPRRSVVEVWHPGDEAPLVATDELTWRIAAEAPELRLSVRHLFERLPSSDE